jgi:pimeloyl-ACP methyl ester carboxylesterase
MKKSGGSFNMNLLAKERPIIQSDGTVLKDSISLLTKLKIGNVDQHLLIRGEDKNNPVLLMIHGGPGQSEIYLSHRLNQPLEKYFTIVNWDQRGAAKSFSSQVKPETMNLNQLLTDAEEVIRYVKTLLQKENEKFFLHGHSFGTILGMLMVKQYPYYFHSYIGTAQCVGLQENLMVSYEYVLQKAKEMDHRKAINELEAIGKPPFKQFSKGLWKYSVWLEKFGGKMHNRDGKEIFKSIFSAPEYSLLDKVNFFRGSLFSVKHMHQELLSVDLREIITSVDIPVYFFLGAHDYSCPFILAEQYFENLSAPKKEIVWFRDSGHMPQYEEPKEYVNKLIQVFLEK